MVREIEQKVTFAKTQDKGRTFTRTTPSISVSRRIQSMVTLLLLQNDFRGIFAPKPQGGARFGDAIETVLGVSGFQRKCKNGVVCSRALRCTEKEERTRPKVSLSDVEYTPLFGLLRRRKIAFPSF